MQSFLTYISNCLKSVEQRRAARYDKTILALELIYLQAMKTKKPSFRDAMAAASKIILAHVFLPEFYFVLFSITFLVFANGAFIEPGVDYGQVRPLLLALTGVLAGVLPLALAFVTAPFHLLIGANLWLLTSLHVVLTAVIFSAIQPLFARLFLDEGIAEFAQLLFPMLIFYGFAEFYLLARLNPTLSFSQYKARHRQPSIKNLIPAPKSGPLISMTSQDHYVEIVTKNGNHLERLTMKNAVAMVPDAAGLQVHRSHWVAYNAMLSLEKTAGRHAVLLQNGTKIPVGKSKLAEVQAFLANR